MSSNHMSLQFENQKQDVVIKNWNDNDKLEDIVKNEYKKKNKIQYIQKSIEILEKNQLHFLEDWKSLSKEQKNKYPDGLKVMLDEAVNSKKKQKKNCKCCRNCCSCICCKNLKNFLYNYFEIIYRWTLNEIIKILKS